jgi:hypothetical protein
MRPLKTEIQHFSLLGTRDFGQVLSKRTHGDAQEFNQGEFRLRQIWAKTSGPSFAIGARVY